MNQTVSELRQENEAARSATTELEKRLTALQTTADETAQALAQAQNDQ